MCPLHAVVSYEGCCTYLKVVKCLTTHWSEQWSSSLSKLMESFRIVNTPSFVKSCAVIKLDRICRRRYGRGRLDDSNAAAIRLPDNAQKPLYNVEINCRPRPSSSSSSRSVYKHLRIFRCNPVQFSILFEPDKIFFKSSLLLGTTSYCM